MKVTWTAAQLNEFEDEIAALFLEKKIRSPIHLSGGNEAELIRIFNEVVDENDWICTNWRSHFHCLLKGVPPAKLRQAILDGHSISLCFPEYRVLSSAIVGGTAPWAVGLAMAIKRKGERRKVVCFLGDMSAECGIVHEAMKYADGFDLPILWVVENNKKSVSTDTRAAWGSVPVADAYCFNFIRYTYTLTRPHVGVGTFVSF